MTLGSLVMITIFRSARSSIQGAGSKSELSEVGVSFCILVIVLAGELRNLGTSAILWFSGSLAKL